MRHKDGVVEWYSLLTACLHLARHESAEVTRLPNLTPPPQWFLFVLD